MRFRDLDDAEIERYLRAEQPYDCAGSAKVETLGIALLEAIESDDPTALDRPAADPHLRAAAPGRHRPADAGACRERRPAMTAPGALHLMPNTLDFGAAGARRRRSTSCCRSA